MPLHVFEPKPEPKLMMTDSDVFTKSGLKGRGFLGDIQSGNGGEGLL